MEEDFRTHKRERNTESKTWVEGIFIQESGHNSSDLNGCDSGNG